MSHALWLVCALAAGLPDTPAVGVPVDRLSARLAEEVTTGSLLLSEGDCLAVKTFTGSPYTHVGIVVVRRGTPMVYDSTNGAGVRCLPLPKYLAWVGEHPVTALHPAQPLADDSASALETSLDKELGRPYAIAHHLTGQRCDGLHCAEYATDALVAARVVKVRQAPRVSPASLTTGLLDHQLYTTGSRLVAEVPPPPASNSGSWCTDCWNDTVVCTQGCWRKLKGMVLCR